MKLLNVIIVSLVTAGAHAVIPRLVQDERRLLTDLLTNYSEHVRPVARPNDTVTITLGLSLLQINEFDQYAEILHTTVWLSKNWKDVLLQWDSKDYNGIESIRVPPDKVWKPDIVLYNSAGEQYGPVHNTLAVVYSSGDVSWIPPMHLHSICNVDLTKFPFDTQTCRLIFGSWTYDTSKVNISTQWASTIDIKSLSPNREWAVVNTSAKRNSIYYACCPEEYADITFTLQMARRSHAYAHTVLAPSVMLAVLIPFTFLLPPGTTEKTSLGTGVLLSLILVALMLYDLLPPGNHSVPAIAVYNMVCIALTGFSLACSAVVNTIWYKKGSVPEPLKMIFLRGLGRVLCVSLDTYYTLPYASASQMPDEKETSDTGRGEWQLLSMVLDRMLLIVFIVAVFCTSIAILA